MSPINPGPGWRLLVDGETRQEGDEFWSLDKRWKPISRLTANLRWFSYEHPVRRRLPQPQPTGGDRAPEFDQEARKQALQSALRLQDALSRRDADALAEMLREAIHGPTGPVQPVSTEGRVS